MPKPSLVEENVPGFTGEGHLYRLGDTDYVVFRVGNDPRWSVAVAAAGGKFGATVLRGCDSRADALRELAQTHG